MANYTAQYTFGVSADTKSAQTSLNQLDKSLRNLQSSKYRIQVDDARITEASQAAGTLRTALQSAMNVDTGKLNLNKFNSELKAAGTTVGQLSEQLLNAGTQGQQAFQQLTHAISGAQAPVKQLNAVLSQMGTTLLNTIKWQAASSLIHGLMSTISGAISYAKNLNTTLNDIRIVTGASSDEMARFAEQANRAAKNLSTSTNDFAKASLIFYQQGDSAELAAKKAEITTKAANVAFTASAREMSEMLTAVWNSFQMGEDQLEHAVDVMAKLGANTASSMEEMAKAMQKVAATANTVGVSMDQMAAIVATAASVTRQAPETIGTAWNTILNRISNLKLGETLEDGVDLTKYTKALQSIGVNVLDATGQLRDMGDVVDEIGEKWQTLDRATKSALASTIGGVRQYTQINAFFENFDKYQKNLQNYTGNAADGELNKQQEIYAQSWEAASKRAQAAMETVYSQLINDKAIIQLKDFFTTLLNLGTSLTSTFGGLGNVIALIGTALVNANIDKISTSIQEAGLSIKQLFSGNQEINEYAATLASMRTEMEGLISRVDVDSSTKTELSFDVKILEMKEQLVNASSRLTAKQKEQAEQYIQNMESAKQYYTELLQQQEELIKNTQASADAIKTNLKERLARNDVNSDYDEQDWAERQREQRVANHMLSSTNLISDDDYDKLVEAAVQMGIIADKSQEVTVNKLVETLEKANQEAGKFESILDTVDGAFTAILDKQGNIVSYDLTSYMGSDEARKAMLESMANSAANSSDTAVSLQGQSLVSQLSSIDASEVTKLQPILDELIELLHKAAERSGEVADNVQRIGETAGGGTQEVVEELDNLANNARQCGASMGQLESDAAAAAAALEKKFQAGLKSASTGIQGFVTTAMTLTRVTTAISAVGNAMDKLSDPNVSGWQKFVTVISTFTTVGMACNSVMKALTSAHKGLIVQTWKNLAATGAATTAQTAHGAAYMFVAHAVAVADKAIKSFMTGTGVGAILLVIAAVASLIAIIGSLIASADKKWQQDMAKRQEELTEAINKTAESADKLKTDLQSLSSIMADTSLSYDEQLAKVNEICNAYGVQANMLDILSGNYEGLAASMQKAATASIDANYWDAQTNSVEAQDIVNDYVKRKGSVVSATNNSGKGRNFWSGNIENEDELQAIKSLSSAIEDLGFKVSDSGITGNGNALELYKLIQSDSTLSQYAAKEGTYLNALNSNFSNYGYDQLINAQDTFRSIELQKNLIHSSDFDMFGQNKTDATVAEIAALVKEAQASTVEERTMLAEYLSGFTNYNEAAAQYSAVNTLAGQAATVNLGVDASLKDKEELSQEILDSLLEDGTLTVETLVHVKPTDVVMDEDGHWTISEQAKKLAEDAIKIEKARTTQEQLDANEKLMTGKSFKKEDYQTLWESGLFETEEELLKYMQSSKDTRTKIWQQMYDNAIEAETEGLSAAIEDGKARIPELESELESWYKDLGNSAKTLAAEGIINSDDILGLQGEALYKQLDAIRFKYNQSQQTNQATLDAYNALGDNATDDQKNEFAREYLDLEKWDDSKVKEQIANVRAAISESKTIISSLDDALTKGDNLVANLATTKDQVEENSEALKASHFYENWTKEVNNASTASEKFAAAIGKQGTLTADALTELARFDEDVYNKYTQMSGLEWNEYAYKSAIDYYNKLAELYKDDEAMMIELQQKKKAATETYYKSIKSLAESQGKAEKDALDEYITKTKTAFDALDKADLSTQSGVLELKQALIDVGYAAEEADELINAIGKDKDNKTAEELWAKANAEIALLLQGQQALDEKKAAAKYLVEEDHEGLVYLKDDEAKLKDLEPGHGTYELVEKDDKLYLIDPKTHTLVELTNTNQQVNGYTITFTKDGKGQYYVGDDGKLHDLTPAGKNKDGYIIYANPEGDGFFYFDTDGTMHPLQSSGVKTKDGYTIYSYQDKSGNSHFEYFDKDGHLKELTVVGSNINGYSVYAHQATDGKQYFQYLTENGELKDFTAAGETSNGYTIYASKDTNTDGWIYINENGQAIGLKQITSEDATYKVLADADGIAWLVNTNEDGSVSLKKLTGSDEDTTIIEKLKAEGEATEGWVLKDGVWTVQIDDKDLEKHLKVKVSYEDVEGQIAKNNKKWMNIDDTKHEYLEGTGFRSIDGSLGSLNAIGDYFGFEGKYGAGNTGWLGDVEKNWAGNVVDWLKQNDKIGNSDTRARTAYTKGAKSLSHEVLKVAEAIEDGKLGHWESIQRETDEDTLSGYYYPDSLEWLVASKYGLDSTEDLTKYRVKDTDQTLKEYIANNQKYIRDPNTNELTGEMSIELPLEIEFIADAEKGFEDLIPMTMEDLKNSDAMDTLLGLLSSWIAAGLDPDTLFENIDEKFDFMKLLSTMFSIDESGELAEGYNEIAYLVMQGFIEGLTGEEPEVQALLTAFGVDSLDTLRAAFGIQSPSKYTREMGAYLVEGLNEGINETEVDVDAFGKSVIDKIKESIEKNKSSLNMDEVWQNLLDGQVVNAASKKKWLQSHSIEVRESSTNAGQYILIDTKDGSLLLGEQEFASEDEAANAGAALVWSDEEIKRYLNGGYWNDSDLTNLQKVVYEEIINKTLKALGKGDTFEDYLNNGGTVDEFATEWNKQYKNYLGDMEDETQVTWAKIGDIISTTLTAIDAEDQKKTATMLERWQNIYEGIAAARKAAFEDKDATYGNTLSKDQISAMVQEKILNNPNMTTADILAWRNSPIDINSEEMQYKAYSTRNLESKGTAYSGFEHFTYGAPNIQGVSDYYNRIYTNDKTSAVARIKESGTATGVANAYNILNDETFDKTSEGLKDRLIASLMEANPQYQRYQAEAYATEALGFDANQDSVKLEIPEGSTLEDVVANYLAQVAQRSYDENIANELAQYEEDATFHLSAAAQAILESYSADAEAAVDDFASWQEQLKTDETAVIQAKQTKALNEQSIVQTALTNNGKTKDMSKEDKETLLDVMKQYGIESLDELETPEGLTKLQQANTDLGTAADKAASEIETLKKAIDSGFLPNGDGTWTQYDMATGEAKQTYTEEQMYSTDSSVYTSGNTTYQTEASTFNTETAESNLSDWLSSVDSQLSTLDTLQKALEDSSTSASDLAKDFLSMHDAIDMTNPEIATAYEHLQMASEGTYSTQAAVDEMTDALLRNGNVIIEDTAELDAYMTKWKETYGITNKNGTAYDAASLKALRLANGLTKINNTLSTVNTGLKKNYKSMNEMRKEAEKANKSIKQLTEGVEDLSEEDKEVIEDFDNLYDAFDKVADHGDEWASFDEDFADAVANCENDADRLDMIMDEVVDIVSDTTLGEKMGEGWADLQNSFANNIEGFKNAASENLSNLGIDVSSCIDTVMQTIQEHSGNLSEINWGTLANTMGVDLSTVLSILQEIINYYSSLNGMEEFDFSSVIADLQAAYSQGQNISNKYGGSGGSHNANTNNSSNSGGGGGSKETKDHKTFEDEYERYHTINEQLDLMSKKLTQIDKLKSRSYGKQHLAEINAEIEGLKQQVSLEEEKLRQAQEYLATDRARMQAEGATFNDDGSIANYEALMQSWIDEYNAAVDEYNNSDQEQVDKDKFEDAEDLYEDRLKWLEQYEESLETVADQENQILELQNKISAANLEKITYVVTLKTELNESDRKVIDYFTKTMEDSLNKQSERMSKLVKKNREYEDDLAVTREAIAQLEEQHRLWEESGGMDGINDADYAEQMQAYRDSMTQTLSDMYENMEKIKEVYKDTLELADEKISHHVSVMQHAGEVASDYIEILGLMGRKVPYKELEQFYELQYTSGLEQIKVEKEYVEVLESQLKHFEDKKAAGIELSETEQAQYEELQKSYIEAENNLLSVTKTTLTNLQTMHQAHIQGIMDDLAKVNTSTFNNIQQVSDAYSHWTEQQNNYLHTGKQLYEVNKINRKIEDSIADASTDAAKARLQALKDEINLKAKDNKLTEYSIQQFEYQYQLALALQEIEEARDAKSTVRLVRDENGNFGYQYTADQDSLDEAEQHYEDVLEQIRDLTTSTADAMAQGYINARVQMEQELAALDESDFENHEAYLKARDEIYNYYMGQMSYYAEQYEIVTGDLAENLNAISDHYGSENADISDMMRTSVNEDIEAMIDNHDEYVTAVDDAITQINTENESYRQKLDEVTAAAGVDYASMTTSVATHEAALASAAEEAQEVISVLGDELDEINDVTDAWDDHMDMIQDTIDSYEDLIDTIGELLETLADLDDATESTSTGTAPSQESVTPTSSTPTGSTPTSSTPTSSTPTTSSTPRLSGWKWDGSYHWKENLDTGAIVQKGAHSYSGTITNITKCTVCGRQVTNYTPGGPVETNNRYAEGGIVDYTGPAWVDGTKSRPEYMLDADQTASMFSILESRTVENLLTTMQEATVAMLASLAWTSALGVHGSHEEQILQQDVHITAEFPAVTDRYEIEEAFNNLINHTSQYIARR